MKLRSMPRGYVQEDCYQHDLDGSLHYALCLGGVVVGSDATDLARCLASDALPFERECAEQIMIQSLKKAAPDILPGSIGPILVLMVL